MSSAPVFKKYLTHLFTIILLLFIYSFYFTIACIAFALFMSNRYDWVIAKIKKRSVSAYYEPWQSQLQVQQVDMLDEGHSCRQARLV